MLKLYVQDQANVTRAKSLHPDQGDDLPDLLPEQDLEEALRKSWPTDAHFLTYFIPGETDIFPLAKIALGLIRVSGGDVLVRYLAVDLDKEPHEQWSGPEELAAAEDELATAFSKSDVPLPAVYYPTLKGMRLIYILTEPVSTERAEPLHRGLLSMIGGLGLTKVQVDGWKKGSTSDWTRCFRLPDVVRKGERTPDWLLERLEIDTALRVNPDTINELGPPARATRQSLNLRGRPMPDPEMARGILFDKNKQTEVHKQAKRRLKNRDCYPYIWPESPQALQDLLPERGTRDTIMMKVAGQVISLIFSITGSRPEHAFALLLDWVSIMPPEEADLDPLSNLWGKILRLWEQEDAKQEIREELEIREEIQEEVARRKKLVTANEVLAAAREIWPKGMLPDDDNEAMLVLSRRAILARKLYFVLQKNGTYSTMSYGQQEIYAGIRESGIDGVIIQTQGEDRLVPLVNILRNHMTPVTEVSYQVGGFPPGLRGGIPSRDGSLIFPVTRIREDLEPAYNDDVNDWLQCLVGADNFQKLCNWIAWSFDLVNPICAIALIGPPSTGKKLFVRGLAECFDPSNVATGAVFGNYAASLRSSVIVSLDEGIPSAGFGTNHPSEMFRSLVAGDPIHVNEKYIAPYTVRAPSRLIITANTMGILSSLAKAGFTEDDRKALIQRIYLFSVKQAAADFLAERGGAAFTGKDGVRWIAPDGEADGSDYLIARHFLWLRDNFKRLPRGNRLLMEGMDGSELTYRLRGEADVEANLIQLIMNYVETSAAARTLPSMYVESDGEIYCTVAFARHLLSPNISCKVASAALKAISAAEFNNQGQKNIRIQGIVQRWHRLDKHLLFWAAEEIGYARKRFCEITNIKSPREA